jgi:hypothetical protein
LIWSTGWVEKSKRTLFKNQWVQLIQKVFEITPGTELDYTYVEKNGSLAVVSRSNFTNINTDLEV